MAVPKIRIKGYTDEWVKKGLTDTVELFGGLTYTPSNIRESGTLVLRSSNVQNGEISLLDNVFVESSVVNSPFVQKGDIIVVVRNGSRALIGKHAHIKEDINNAVIGAFMSGIRHKNSEFINALLDTSNFHSEVDKNLGATINQITNATFRSMIFNFPSDAEQRALGNFFDTLDNQITMQTSRIATLKQTKQASLQSMFPQEGETKPRVRFKGFEGDWSKTTFGDLLSFERPDNYIVTNDKYSDNYFTPVLTANKGFILGYTNETRTYNKKCIIFDDFTLDNKYVDFPFMVKSSALKILTLKKPEVDNLYFIYALLNRTNIEVLGHARHYISVVQPTEVLVPADCNEQKQIAEYFSNLDKQISIQEQRLEKLKQIKSACLKNMFV